MISKSSAIFFSLSLILFAKVGGSCWTIGFGGSSSMTGDSTVGVSGMSGGCSSSGISVDSVFEDSVGIFSFGESSFSCDWKLSRIG